jgi:hypothetical protein
MMDLDAVSEADVDRSNKISEKSTKPKNNHATKMTENADNKCKRTPLPTSRLARFRITSNYPSVDASNPNNKGNHAARSNSADLSLFGPAVAKRVEDLLNKIDAQSRATNDPKRWFAEEDELLELLRQEGLKYGATLLM